MKNNLCLKTTLLFIALILVSIQAGGRDPGLYYASPDDLPSWAGQGAFRFIRLDGGRIESLKAERTWWGKEFTEQEKDILAHVYDRHFDRMLALLKQARFNWIWVTWSNGWSIEEEAENREDLKRVIERCHKEGIRVTAYMSASNMFWKSAYKDDPETRKYGLWTYGIPLFYGGISEKGVSISFQRRLADMKKPGWRAYLVAKARMAVDAGVDAVFFDNVIGNTEAARLLMTEVQEMCAASARETGRPKAMVYSNVHIAPYRFDLNDHGEVLWMEDGKDSPGVWEGLWQVENARKIKFLYGEKQAWQPLMYENDVYHCGHRETCIPAPEVQKLAIAETYAFGAALSRNIEGRFLEGLVLDTPEAMAAWAAIAEYNAFIEANPGLYQGVEPAARIALAQRKHDDGPADEFIRKSVIFETKVWDHLGKGTPMENFRVLVVPFSTGGLGPEQERVLSGFAASGGVILTPEPERLARRLGVPEGGNVRALVDGEEPAGQAREAAAGPLVEMKDGGGYVLAQITRKSGQPVYVLHLINYDLAAAGGQVRVRLGLDSVPSVKGYRIEILSPDAPAPEVSDINTDGAALEFTIGPLHRYAVAVISAGG